MSPSPEFNHSQEPFGGHKETAAAPRFEYRILDQTGDPDLKFTYLNYTDRLIHKAQFDNADVMLFLDKSARPVAWMVKEFWPLLARDVDGRVTKPLPQLLFLNIDREQWQAIVGHNEAASGINFRAVPRQLLGDLRAVFARSTDKPADSWQTPTFLDGKNVLVVDEVMNSGSSLQIAGGLLERAIPEATVTKEYWMTPAIKTDRASGARVVKELPVWYSDTDITGRLVGNRDTYKSSLSPSWRQRVGGLFLSAPFRHGVDQKGVQLKNEIKQMAMDFKNGLLPCTPTSTRSNSEELTMLYTGMSSHDFTRLKETVMWKKKNRIPASVIDEWLEAKKG
ncbi:MAG: hypothetical protein EOT04_01795 [Candidatus Chaera renei]|uniref:Uncharacterized protein n=1 Tax=Candidatus Chaera renei TaxID=2506947 RepID=A0A4Q0AJ94_9BACT|nr:MAG: hypothetical protein EOT04_01795 [Candidatus Chaera renei]